MSAVSFSGLATGLDTASLVSQLVELKRAPIYRLQSQRNTYQNQISALGSLKSKLLAFQTAAQNIDTANEFASLVATSNDEDVLQVSAGSSAAPGSYNIVVDSLAKAQKSLSQGFDNTLVSMGEGTLSFTIGGEEQTLELSGYTNVEALAERINNEVDGLSATIIFDGSETGGYFLSLSGDAGTGGAFTVDASGLSGGTTPTFTETETATDAHIFVDNLEIWADGNHLEDVISGLTLDLRGLSAEGTSVLVEVETDTEGVTEQVKGLIDAYNDIMGFLDTALANDGALAGNTTARSVMTRLQNVMSAVHDGGGEYSMLAMVGVERQQGSRTLKFDVDAFEEALVDNYAAVRDLFIERDGNVGKAALIDAAIDDLTDSTEGLFKLGTKSLNRRIDNIDDNIVRYERSIESYRTTLERKFLAMERTVALLNAQGNALSTMVFFGQQ